MKRLLKPVDYLIVHLDLSLTQFDHCFERLNVERGVTSRTKLIIHLEDPNVHVKVLDDESCQSQLKFKPVLDVIGTHRDRDVAELENALSTALSRVDDVTSRSVWFSTHDWDAKLDRQLDVILSYFPRYDISLLAVN